MVDVFNPAVEEQLIEARIAEIKETGTHGFSTFIPGDSELAGAVEGGKMGFTSTAADKVTLYDQESGEPREGILVNMLSKILKKKKPNGGRAFDLNPPTNMKWKQGDVLCYFHPQHENRKVLDRIGLGTAICTSAHIASEYDARMHAEHRHGQWYKVLNEHLEAEEKRDDRARQEKLAEAMLASVGARERKAHDCGDCDRFFDSAQGLTLHRNKEHS